MVEEMKECNKIFISTHNTHGFLAISDFLSMVDASPKVGIIAGVGDRRDEDIRNLGRVAAGMFDEIIIRQDKNLRGRTEENIIELMTEGIQSIWGSLPEGEGHGGASPSPFGEGRGEAKKITVLRKEREAIEYAAKGAVPHSLKSPD